MSSFKAVSSTMSSQAVVSAASATGSAPASISWKHRISRAELVRRVNHMAPGVLSFALWAFPHRDPLSPTAQVILTAIIVAISFKVFLGFRTFRRDGERQTQATWAVLGYSISVLACLVLLPAHAQIGIGVLGILAFGDGSATLGGLLLRGPALPWNRSKSWSGLCCFLVFGTGMSALMYWGESHNLEAQTPGVSFGTALACTGFATVLAALAESLPSRINDNIRVGLTASMALIVAHGMLVGWGG